MTLFALHGQDQSQTLASTLRRPLRSWRRTVACFLIAITVAAGAFLAQTPQFTARTDVVVIAVTGSTNAATQSDVSIDSAVQILYSDAVLGETARLLDYPGRSSGLLDDLSIDPLINSRLLQLKVSNPDARLAYRAVTMLTERFLSARLQRLTEQNEESRKELEETALSLQSQLASIGSSGLEGLQRRELAQQLGVELAEAQAAISAIDNLPPSAGFVSRQAVMPAEAYRSGRAIFLASALGLALVASAIVAPQHLRNRKQLQQLKEREKVDLHG